MAARDYAAIIIAISVAVLVYYLVRLTTRLERSAQAVDDLLATTRHEMELTMQQSRAAIAQLHEDLASANVILQQLSTIGNSAQEQLKKIEKVVGVAETIVDGVRLNTVLLEKAVANPLAKVTGAWAGLSRGMKVLRQIKSKGEKA